MKAVLKIAAFCCTLLVVATAPDGNLKETREIKDDILNYLDIAQENRIRLASRAERVEPAECPYYASMQVSGKHDCGGALISPNHVLTAAHCLYPILQNENLARKVTIEVGSVSIGSGTSHAVKRLSYHRQYVHANSASQYIQPNDVAVITLKTPVTESEHVKIISLPSAGLEVPAGAQVKVSGFGNARLGGPTSQVLQKSDLYTVSHTECNTYYSTYLRKNILRDSQICAKGGYGYGACQGDSGGPMVYNNQVVGLVSAGDGMCGAGNPDIYTKVSHFMNYIQSELNGGDENLAIALDLGGKSGRREESYPGVSQYPTSQVQYYPIPGQYPPVGRYPVSQYPIAEAQYPVSQYPTSQYPVSQYPVSQYPTSQYPVSQYPVSQYPVNQYPITNIQYYPISDQYPSVGRYPTSQYPNTQYPVNHQYPGTNGQHSAVSHQIFIQGTRYPNFSQQQSSQTYPFAETQSKTSEESQSSEKTQNTSPSAKTPTMDQKESDSLQSLPTVELKYQFQENN